LDKTFKQEFEKGTDIGFQMDEIKKTSTEDLMILRSSIVSYLKSKKLKKRNSNYMGVFLRINQELSLRKRIPKFITTTDIVKNFPAKETGSGNSDYKLNYEGFFTPKNYNCSSAKAQKLFDFFEYEKNRNKGFFDKKLLGNKTFLQDASHLEIHIPSFLNDKYSLKIKKLKETLQENEDDFKSALMRECSTNYSGISEFLRFFNFLNFLLYFILNINWLGWCLLILITFVRLVLFFHI